MVRINFRLLAAYGGSSKTFCCNSLYFAVILHYNKIVHLVINTDFLTTLPLSAEW